MGHGGDSIGTVLNSKDQLNMTIYYSVFIAVANIAWSCGEISHLSLIPEITPRESKRGSLASIRNMGTAISSMFVYSTTWIMFGIGKT